MRAVFGEFRPPTGIDISANANDTKGNKDLVATLRERVNSTGQELGHP